MSKYRRLTDNDRHFGPFDLGERHAGWRPLSLVLESGDDEYTGCALMMRAFGWTLRLRLPEVLQPSKRWVDTSRYAWAGPGGGYWDIHSREFGFSLSEGFLQVFLGPQTGDSLTEKNWCTHLPWTQWRFVRRSFYGLNGEHFWTEPTGRQVPRHDAWKEMDAKREACPKAAFEVEDYDGQRIAVTTSIEEMEWRFGQGWFKWLSLFRRSRVRRSLDIHFAKEVGPEKGSWKGGLVGTGIEMLPGELHEAALRRFCEQEHQVKYGRFRLKFVGAT